MGLRPGTCPRCCPESAGWMQAGWPRCSVPLLLGYRHSPVGQSTGAAWGRSVRYLGGTQVGAEELPVEWVTEGEVLELPWKDRREMGMRKMVWKGGEEGSPTLFSELLCPSPLISASLLRAKLISSLPSQPAPPSPAAAPKAASQVF